MLEPPSLHGFYFKRGSRDHVALYIITSYKQNGTRAPDFEIAEMGFFPFDALPEGTSPATRARIAEIFAGRRPRPTSGEGLPDWRRC